MKWKAKCWVIATLMLLVGLFIFAMWTDRASAAGPAACATVESAICTVLHNGDPDHMTKSGKPKVKTLKAILGKKVTGDERDAAWAGLKNPAPATKRVPDEAAELKAELELARGAMQQAQLNLRIKQRELREALSAHTQLQRRSQRDIEAARAEARGVMSRYQRLMSDAEQDRSAARARLTEAKERLAEAKLREAGAGPSSSRTCRATLRRLVTNADTSWLSDSVRLDAAERLDIDRACLR